MKNEHEVVHEEAPGLNGMYPVQIYGVSEVKSGNYGSYVIVEFSIPADNSPSGREFLFTAPFSMILSKRSRLGRLTNSVFGRLPDLGKALNVMDLPGKKLVLGMSTEVGDNFDKFIIDSFHPEGSAVSDPRMMDIPAVTEDQQNEVPF